VSVLRTQWGWTHYKTLLSVDNSDKRDFYLAEVAKNNWSARQLERQVNSQLFERLLLSGSNMAAVLAVHQV
jgi:predicted nuclease of restriction endonuclease-like (RecB) superfamily